MPNKTTFVNQQSNRKLFNCVTAHTVPIDSTLKTKQNCLLKHKEAKGKYVYLYHRY